jgi:hypothetical protein
VLHHSLAPPPLINITVTVTKSARGRPAVKMRRGKRDCLRDKRGADREGKEKRGHLQKREGGRRKAWLTGWLSVRLTHWKRLGKIFFL